MVFYIIQLVWKDAFVTMTTNLSQIKYMVRYEAKSLSSQTNQTFLFAEIHYNMFVAFSLWQKKMF